MITVRDLKKILNTCEDSDVVILSSDAEGNKYSPFDEIGEGYYHPDSEWEGDFSYEEEGGISCVVLFPIN
jgi:hypothetical protein